MQVAADWGAVLNPESAETSEKINPKKQRSKEMTNSMHPHSTTAPQRHESGETTSIYLSIIRFTSCLLYYAQVRPDKC